MTLSPAADLLVTGPFRYDFYTTFSVIPVAAGVSTMTARAPSNQHALFDEWLDFFSDEAAENTYLLTNVGNLSTSNDPR